MEKLKCPTIDASLKEYNAVEEKLAQVEGCEEIDAAIIENFRKKKEEIVMYETSGDKLSRDKRSMASRRN